MVTDAQLRLLRAIHERVIGGEIDKPGSKVMRLDKDCGVEECAAFAVRDAAGLMLIASPMAKAGLPLDAPEQRSAYLKARTEFLAKLRANHVVAVVPTATTF